MALRPTLRCLKEPGFVKRSLEEAKRLSNYALKFEGLSKPTKGFPLIQFETSEDIEKIKVFSDADTGGFSKTAFDFHSGTQLEPSHARFHGSISLELPPDRPHIQRSGYAAWRTKDRKFTMFGKSLWDLDMYNYLAIQFKSDGRKYFINVQTESIVPTDIHQHRLYSKSPGKWETILVRWKEFVRTNHGQVVEPQREILTQKVRSVGIGLIDRIPGPYDLSVHRIWATNALKDDKWLEEAAARGPISGALHSRTPEKINLGQEKEAVDIT